MRTRGVMKALTKRLKASTAEAMVAAASTEADGLARKERSGGKITWWLKALYSQFVHFVECRRSWEVEWTGNTKKPLVGVASVARRYWPVIIKCARELRVAYAEKATN